MWKEGGKGETEPLPAARGREGRRVRGKGKAGSGVEPQVGEERVFPVSHEVIHEEASDFGPSCFGALLPRAGCCTQGVPWEQ